MLVVGMGVAVSGCGMIGKDGDAPEASAAPEAVSLLPDAKAQKVESETANSEIIDALMARRSVLPSGSSEAQLAEAVIAADMSPAAVELRAAVLRSKARDKNWLPKLDPRISLTGLSVLDGSLLTDLVLFGNGGKKAERNFARADIDVAAVALSQTRNQRIADALSLQNARAEAEEKLAISNAALTRLKEYRRVLAGRVGGGIENPSDLTNLDQIIASLDADAQTERRAAEGASGQLSVLTAGVMASPPNPTGFAVPGFGNDALPVLNAKAEAERARAEADLARASLSPQLSAGASGGAAGVSGGLSTGGSVMIFGREAQIESIEAQAAAAEGRVQAISEQTERQMQRARDDAASAEGGVRDAKDVAARLAENHRIFDAQFRAGQRKLLEAAKLYVSLTNQRKEAVSLAARAREARIELAREQGVLIDGSRI
ncbi:TolC family protein [Palleronia caenipelagi]|uniref:TolC family protein n=1 Tax=Palleronia caenipelagi TaxID=2489174 RepID=A0A547PRD2_9RHOB|nr:hypothetical protein [Palleronia caenipelagi]TRD16679.1 hypothetical protein FEV53_13835 [Palleronia caenipelagi]